MAKFKWSLYIELKFNQLKIILKLLIEEAGISSQILKFSTKSKVRLGNKTFSPLPLSLLVIVSLGWKRVCLLEPVKVAHAYLSNWVPLEPFYSVSGHSIVVINHLTQNLRLLGSGHTIYIMLPAIVNCDTVILHF